MSGRLLSVAALLALVAACASPTRTPSSEAPAAATSLKGVCPDTVVVQMNWFPQAEHGGLYRLLGSGFTVDGQRKAVEGPLLDDGGDTGVRLQVRAGGPVTGFQRVSALMAADPSITLGSIATDEAVQESGTGSPSQTSAAPTRPWCTPTARRTWTTWSTVEC
jgi:hypothetical protein